FDKTGTLTERKERLVFKGHLSDFAQSAVRSLAHQSNHPRSQQIAAFFPQAPLMAVDTFRELPGQGIIGKVAGKKIAISKCRQGTEVQIDGQSQGYFEHQPILRKGLKAVMAQLKSKYQLSLLSGDRNRHWTYFVDLFGGRNALHFNHRPQEKLQYIQSLQKKGAVVMMIGDGLNDAGALQQADVGLVITEDNNNFSPACDGVLSEKAFATLPRYLAYVNQSRWVIYGAYTFALCYNFVGLSYAVQGLLSPVIAAILMPLSSISIISWGILGTWLVSRKILASDQG
ncbi:MAG: HAD-IC family P-type ATPase, partial [Bacteroidota bacterium]